MQKYLLKASLSPEGARGTMKEGGTARRAAATKAVEGLGGKVESFYYAFGDTDAYLIVDLPDNVAAVAMAMAVSTSGAVAAETVVLITPEEVDRAAKMTVAFRPPGG
ncbi:MAG: GYD domain-containing protein [Actinomycetota bacterium]